MKKFNLKREKRKLWIRQHKSQIIKYGSVFICALVLGMTIMYFSQASFSTKVTFDVIDARVAPFSSGDVQFAFNVEGTTEKTLDTNEQYFYYNNECTNGTTYIVTNGDWKNGTIGNLSDNGTKCTLYFYKPKIEYYLDGQLSSKENISDKYFSGNSHNECSNGATINYNHSDGTYSLTNVNTLNITCNLYFTSESSFVYDVLKNNMTLLASASGDTNPIYYYSGYASELNNNVNFAGKCWKIIRTTSSGGIKMIYNGTLSDGQCNETTGSSTQIGISRYNTTYNSTIYNSTAKSTVDSWYNSNLSSTYDSWLETTQYCGDTLNTSNPLTCSTSYTLKVGLISAGEAYLAGLNKTNTNTTNYLYTGQQYWTMSAGSGTTVNGSTSIDGSNYKQGRYNNTSSNILTIDTDGRIYNSDNGTYSCIISSCWDTYSNIYLDLKCCTNPTTSYDCNTVGAWKSMGGGLNTTCNNSTFSSGSSLGLRPVISLSPSVKIKDGNGSTTSPYTLTLES